MALRVGTIGWGYAQWKGVFYPAALQPKQYLAHYSRYFDTVEIDSTFYGTPPAERMRQWGSAVPDTFRFSVKTPQQITHDARLTDIDGMLGFVDITKELGGKLGPILIQLPPDFTFGERAALATFIAKLPTDVRYAIEFRHRSWDQAHQATADLLRHHRICWVSADYVIMQKRVIQTTDFLYLRLLGRHGRYETKNRELRDPTAELNHWKREIEPLTDSLYATYAFFNNDYAGYSPESGRKFKTLFGQSAELPTLPVQKSLF